MAEGHMGDDEDLTHEVNSFQDWHFLNRGRAMGTTSCFSEVGGRTSEGGLVDLSSFINSHLMSHVRDILIILLRTS